MNRVAMNCRGRDGGPAALILLAAALCPAPAWAGSSPVELGEIRKGVYEIPGEDIRVRLPASLGRHTWKREFMEITGQFEVHLGDEQCRRYYLKRIAGPVGGVVAADATVRGDEAVLRSLAGQFASRRGERLEHAEWLQTRLGNALLVLATDARGWPCLQAVPDGGRTVSADWFLRRGKELYEIGYQAGVAPPTASESAMAAARAEAAAFLDGVELPGEGRVEPTFPWRAGDPPPTLAGIALGDPREAVESHVGPLAEFDEGDWRLEDEKRRMLVIVSAAKGAELISIGRRGDGDIGGVQVGDRFADVLRKWGPPPEGGPIMPGTDMYIYRAGEWGVTVTVTRDRVDSLSLGAGEAREEPRPVAATAGVAPEPIHTDILPPETEMAVGQRFLLPAGALGNHTGDSVAQQAPGREIVAVEIAGITTSPPVLPGSAPARDRLAELLGSSAALLEITSAVDLDGMRMFSARLSVDGRDVATTLVEEGWAIAIKSRAADPRLLAAEAAARTAKRGLWSMSPAEFGGTGPEEYFTVQISMGIDPEVYVPGE